MAVSGMRYLKMKQLVQDIEAKKAEIDALMDRIQNDRSQDVAQVYSGEAAENFKSNMRTVAETVQQDMASIIKQLNEEADIQHDAYIKQEQNLKSNINIAQ